MAVNLSAPVSLDLASLALDALPAHVAVLSERGQVLLVNRTWLNACGDTDLIGMHYRDATRAMLALEAATPLPDLDVVDSVLDGSRAHATCELVAARGSAHRIHVQATAMHTGDARAVLCLHDADADALRTARSTAAAAEQRLRLMVDGARLGTWEWDLPTGAVSFNAIWFRMLGYEPEAMEGHVRTWEELVHPDDKERAVAAVRAHLAGETADYRCEHRLRRKDGSWSWVLACGRILERHADRTPRLFCGVHVDTTEHHQLRDELQTHRDRLQVLIEEQTLSLRRAKDAAERASQAKSDFLANMTHELRTPMHGILAFAQLGEDRVDTASPPKLGHYFRCIRTSGNRLLALVNDLLDLSKLEAGRMLLDLAEHDICAVAQSVAQELTALAASNSMELRIAPPGCDPHLFCDRTRISQVFRNLLANAIRYSPTGAHVTVMCAEAMVRIVPPSSEPRLVSGIAIAVRDTGIGIPPDELEVIFDKFVQSNRTKSNAGGTGLGLSLCREIVAAHQGTIVARNNQNGPGATFTVTLPRRPCLDDQFDKTTAPSTAP